MRVDGTLWMVLCFMGCDTLEPELTVLDKVQILEEIDANPLEAKRLCSQISEGVQRELHSICPAGDAEQEISLFKTL